MLHVDAMEDASILFTGDIESDMITIQAVGRTADEAYAIMDAVCRMEGA